MSVAPNDRKVVYFKNSAGMDVIAIFVNMDATHLQIVHPICVMQFTAQNRITGQPEVQVQFVPFSIVVPPTSPHEIVVPLASMQMFPIQLEEDNNFYTPYLNTVLGEDTAKPQILVG